MDCWWSWLSEAETPSCPCNERPEKRILFFGSSSNSVAAWATPSKGIGTRHAATQEDPIQELTATRQWRGLATRWTPTTAFPPSEAQQWIMIYSKYLHCGIVAKQWQMSRPWIWGLSDEKSWFEAHLPEVGCLVLAVGDARSHATQTCLCLLSRHQLCFKSWLQWRRK